MVKGGGRCGERACVRNWEIRSRESDGANDADGDDMVSMSPEGLSPGKIVCQNAGGVVNCEVPCDWRFRPANTFPQQDGETTIQSQRMSKATTRFTFCVLRPCWNDLVLMDEFPLFARFAQKKK